MAYTAERMKEIKEMLLKDLAKDPSCPITKEMIAILDRELAKQK